MSKVTIAKRFHEAGIDAERFIQCCPGEKASFDHTMCAPKRVQGNYGIYATVDDRLTILDIDDYNELNDRSGLTALDDFPPTLEQSSPHGGGNHRFYVVKETDDGRLVAEILEDEFGKMNLKPSWGEVRVANQYVVGAGSQLDGCEKDWCDECNTEDGGIYELNDRAIAEISAEQLVDVLRRDPNYTLDDETEENGQDTRISPATDADSAEILAYAFNESNDAKLRRLWNGDYSDYGDDRSAAEAALAAKLGWWLQGDRKAVERVMDGHGLPKGIPTPSLEKWDERDDDSYRDSVLSAVDQVTEFYEPGRRAPSKPSFDAIAKAKADEQATADGGVETDTSPQQDEHEPTKKSPHRALQERIDDVLLAYEADDDMTQRTVVHRAALHINDEYHFAHPPEGAQGWRTTLYRYDEDEGIYTPDGERFIRELSERLLGDFLNNQQSHELVGKITRLSGIQKDDLEVAPYRLVVRNGILDLRTGDLEDYSPDEYHRTKIDVDYHPDAECPRLDEFFHEIVEKKDVDTLYQLAAHCLYREYAAEKAAMLVGDGRNGKSVFLDVLEHFLGGENVTHRSLQDLDGERFAANDLEGKLANFHPDMGDEGVCDLGTFKKMTGRDTMIADVKYENPIKFENYATLLFATNRMPAMDEDTHALWRRWIYLNFPNTFEPDDPDHVPKRVLMQELTTDAELEGLLARCVEEISEWWDGRDWFTSILAPSQVREKMKRASEPVYDFVSVCLEEAEGETIPKDQMRDAYRRYAREEGLPAQEDNVFGEKILNIRDYPIEDGQERHEGARRRVYRHVRLSSRGRQVLGLDEDQDDAQIAVDEGGPRARADAVLEAMRDLGAGTEPVSRGMILGRACASIGLSQAEHGFEELKDHGKVYQPADADDGHWMIS